MLLWTSLQGVPTSLPAPDGALVHMDFTAGVYVAGNALADVADLLGPTFLPASITANGMRIDYGYGNYPSAIGDLLSTILAGITGGLTLVFEVGQTTGLDGPLFYFYDTVNSNELLAEVTGGANATLSWSGFDDTIFWNLSDATGAAPTDPLRAAVSMSRDIGGGNYEYAMAINGRAAKTATQSGVPNDNFSPDELHIGNQGGSSSYVLNNHRIRTMTLYGARTGAQLTALTVL